MNEQLARDVLGIAQNTPLTRQLCQLAFRKKALLFHPDKHVYVNEDAFIACKHARDFLLSSEAIKRHTLASDEIDNVRLSSDKTKVTAPKLEQYRQQTSCCEQSKLIEDDDDITPMDIDSDEGACNPVSSQAIPRQRSSDMIPPIQRFGQIRAIAFAILRIGGIARDPVSIDEILSYLKQNDLLVFKSGKVKLESSGNFFASEKASDSVIKARIASRMRYYPTHFVKNPIRSKYRLSQELLDQCVRVFR